MLRSLGWVPGTAAATGALEEIQISDCNFAASSPPRAGTPVPHQERPGCLKLLGKRGKCSGRSTEAVFPTWDHGRHLGQ